MLDLPRVRDQRTRSFFSIAALTMFVRVTPLDHLSFEGKRSAFAAHPTPWLLSPIHGNFLHPPCFTGHCCHVSGSGFMVSVPSYGSRYQTNGIAPAPEPNAPESKEVSACLTHGAGG